ncbi:Xaa-Pro aminopeptidase [Cutibacterium acnes JCM 18920]|nr:Xaa-Pro aminopeptidase [Cutibacterium acnes JCM 18909]GAE78638.1 Xaa-Pro aminopeptidase [Cutibacterium acnes JCM 18920]
MRRNNDCDYPFRPNTAFAYYSGLGTDREPNAVLVVDTTAETRDVLYFKPRAPRTDREFYADPPTAKCGLASESPLRKWRP